TTVGNGGGILPYAEVNGNAGSGDFATYTAANGVAAYNGYVNVTTTAQFAAAGPNDIVKVTGTAVVVSASQTIGGLVLGGTAAATLSLSAGTVLSLNFGALMTA